MKGSYNLLDELEIAEEQVQSTDLLREAQEIFKAEESREAAIRFRLGKELNSSQPKLERLSGERYFSTAAIKSICIKHRLRFLESKLFKGDIPQEAILQIKRLEEKQGSEFKAFKVIAPSERFRLKDSTKDPILLAQTENDDFLYIHQWGNDMKWYQRLLYFPLSNIQNLAITAFVVAFLASMIMPSDAIPEYYARTSALSFVFRAIIFFTISGLLFTLSLILGVLLEKEFSEDVWNDPYFN